MMNPAAPDSGISDGPPPRPGAIGGLLDSVSTLAARLITIAQTRLELLTTELQEEVQRAAGVVVWAFIALLSSMTALFMGGLTIIVFYWETHRVLAALLVTAAFFAFAIFAVIFLIAKMNSRPRFLDATLNELAKDGEQLRSRLD
jgi:uncharacterized membrane protein YqjE